MQNGKSDKWFERIILVFAYFFLFDDGVSMR